jgi:F0F1-type ATP synthase membrane subunit b/b'
METEKLRSEVETLRADAEARAKTLRETAESTLARAEAEAERVTARARDRLERAETDAEAMLARGEATLSHAESEAKSLLVDARARAETLESDAVAAARAVLTEAVAPAVLGDVKEAASMLAEAASGMALPRRGNDQDATGDAAMRQRLLRRFDDAMHRGGEQRHSGNEVGGGGGLRIDLAALRDDIVATTLPDLRRAARDIFDSHASNARELVRAAEDKALAIVSAARGEAERLNELRATPSDCVFIFFFPCVCVMLYVDSLTDDTRNLLQ